MDFDAFRKTTGLSFNVNYKGIVFFNADSVYNEYKAKRKADPADSLVYVSVIDKTIFNSIEHQSQLIRSETDPMLDSLFKAQQIPADELHKDRFRHYLNDLNSRVLYEWIQDFIAFIQRKAQEKQSKVRHNVAWIYRDAQVEGILIFSMLLITLLMFYATISAQSRKLRAIACKRISEIRAASNAGQLPGEEPVKQDDETVDSVKKDLEFHLKLVQYHLFPAITFMGIIIALLIPLSRPIVAEEIRTSQPDWFLAVPNWNVAGAVVESTVGKVSNTAGPDDQGKNTEEPQTKLRQGLSTDNLVTKEEFRKATDSIINLTRPLSTPLQRTDSYLKK